MEHTANIEYVPNLDGLPTKYHRLEQCQMGLGWSAYAQDQADEQRILQQFYTDLIERADTCDDAEIS